MEMLQKTYTRNSPLVTLLTTADRPTMIKDPEMSQWREPTYLQRCSPSSTDVRLLRGPPLAGTHRLQCLCSVVSLSLPFCSGANLPPRWVCAVLLLSLDLAESPQPSGISLPHPSPCTGGRLHRPLHCTVDTLSHQYPSSGVSLPHPCISSGANLQPTSQERDLPHRLLTRPSATTLTILCTPCDLQG